MAEYPPTPMLDKMSAIKAESQAIGEFLEWLTTKGIHLAHNVEGHNYPHYLSRSTEELLAEFFDIDLNQAEAEKRAILDHIRSAS